MSENYTIEVKDDYIKIIGHIPIQDAILHLALYASQGYKTLSPIDSDITIMIYNKNNE